MSLLAMAAVLALQSPAERESRVPVAELLGRSPAEVATRLGAIGNPTSADSLRIVEEGRVVEVYPARRFWRAASAGEFCVTGFPEVVDPDNVQGTLRQRLARRDGGYLVFENGRLTAVAPEPIAPGGTALGSRGAVEGFARARTLESPWLVAPGRLPASDGVGILDRLWAAPAGLTIASTCAPRPNHPPMRSGDIGTDVIWAMVGLPFLVTVPFARAEHARAEREGGAFLASLEPGAILPEGIDQRAADRRGVQLYRDPADPDFVIVAVKLGPGHHNGADVGLVGVRGNAVVWKA
ncbi:MAG TPA: hypothetical protein VFF48_06810, partial [Brevundimonas sp.]|nr:hypothetical protein [Brevundimonas sp.]